MNKVFTCIIYYSTRKKVFCIVYEYAKIWNKVLSSHTFSAFKISYVWFQNIIGYHIFREIIRVFYMYIIRVFTFYMYEYIFSNPGNSRIPGNFEKIIPDFRDWHLGPGLESLITSLHSLPQTAIMLHWNKSWWMTGSL